MRETPADCPSSVSRSIENNSIPNLSWAGEHAGDPAQTREPAAVLTSDFLSREHNVAQYSVQSLLSKYISTLSSHQSVSALLTTNIFNILFIIFCQRSNVCIVLIYTWEFRLYIEIKTIFDTVNFIQSNLLRAAFTFGRGTQFLLFKVYCFLLWIFQK